MPVITVTSPEHDRTGELLVAVAESVASALGLGYGDVIATHVPSGASVMSGGAAASWPVVAIHGSHRGAQATADARAAVAEAVRVWAERFGVRHDGVWTEWIVPEPAER